MLGMSEKTGTVISRDELEPRRGQVWVSHIYYGEKKTKPLYVRIWKVHELSIRNDKRQTFVRFYSMTDDRRKRITYSINDFLMDFNKAKRQDRWTTQK